MLDIGNQLGLSNTLMRLIEQRTTQVRKPWAGLAQEPRCAVFGRRPALCACKPRAGLAYEPRCAVFGHRPALCKCKSRSPPAPPHQDKYILFGGMAAATVIMYLAYVYLR